MPQKCSPLYQICFKDTWGERVLPVVSNALKCSVGLLLCQEHWMNLITETKPLPQPPFATLTSKHSNQPCCRKEIGVLLPTTSSIALWAPLADPGALSAIVSSLQHALSTSSTSCLLDHSGKGRDQLTPSLLGYGNLKGSWIKSQLAQLPSSTATQYRGKRKLITIIQL